MTTTVISVLSATGNDHGRGLNVYTVPQTWEDDCPTDLVAADQVWKGEAYKDDEFLMPSGVGLTIAGITTDATHKLWLTCAAGESFKDHVDKITNELRYDKTKGVAWRVTPGNYKKFIVGGNKHFLLEGWQLYYNSTYSSAYFPPVEGLENGVFLQCIYESDRVASYDINTGKHINCLFVSRAASYSGKLLIARGAGMEVHASTVVRVGTAGGEGIASEFGNYPLVRNCAVFGFATPFGGTIGSYPAGSGYNATDGASAPGSNNQVSLTYADQFESNASDGTHDFRVKAGSDLEGNGTRDATNTNDLDIVGQARSTAPTIGAWEFVSGGGGTSEGDLSGQGESTATFVGASQASAVLSGAGDSAAAFVGASTSASTLSAPGDSSASFTGKSLSDAALSAAADSAASFTGAALADSVLSAAGDSSAAFVGDSVADGNGTFSAAGEADASFVGQASAAAALSAAADSTATFTGAGAGEVTLSAAGDSAASFVGRADASAVWTAAADSTGELVGASTGAIVIAAAEALAAFVGASIGQPAKAWEVDFYAALIADAALRALVGEQIYPGAAKAGATPPYVVYGRQATERRYSLDGFDTELEKILANVDCYARDAEGAERVARAVIAALPQSGWPLHRTRHASRDMGLDEQTRLFRRLLELSIFHRSP